MAMNVRARGIGLGLGLALGLWGSAAIAAPPLPQLEIGYDHPPFEDRVLEAGAVRVVAALRPAAEDGRADRLTYTLYVNDQPVAAESQDVGMFSTLRLAYLDQDEVPEVVLETYTGGAHCCSVYWVHSWQGDTLVRSQTFPLDLGGGRFEDLDGDGNQEFLTFDNSFLYAFSSYAGSFPPLIVLSFQSGQFIDVTRQHRDRQRAHAWQAYLRLEDNPGTESNGILAGYVAQKILLGEYREGWAFMTARYDRQDDWGLDRYAEGEVVGTYPDYPTALRAFLVDLGYLTPDGRPNLRLDLRDRVIAQTSARPVTP
jgi:hypothetical protein